MTERAAAFDDLTARARIRQAALAQFTAHGYAKTTMRNIAAEAGVSLGLVRHHFGSKEALRDAVDAHVVAEIRRINDEILAGSEKGDLREASISRQAIQPFQGYLVRALMDGSPTMATLFDQMVGMSEEWLEVADVHRSDPPSVDRRTRAAVITAMALGVPLLREHVSRVLGVDTFSPEGDRRVALAALDIYAHELVAPDLAASARAGVEATEDQAVTDEPHPTIGRRPTHRRPEKPLSRKEFRT
jgi:AcrR family transcriptional regulator